MRELPSSVFTCLKSFHNSEDQIIFVMEEAMILRLSKEVLIKGSEVVKMQIERERGFAKEIDL